MKLEGGHLMVIGGSSGIGIAVARLGQHEGAEVTIASRSSKKLIQVQSELEPVHTVVMDMTDEEAVEKGFADLSRVDHWLISAGTILNSANVNYDGSGPFWVPIVSSPSKVYTACRQSDVFRYGSNSQA